MLTGPNEVGVHQPSSCFNAFVNEQEGTSLADPSPHTSIAPPSSGSKRLYGRLHWCFLSSTFPGSFWSEDVVVASNPNRDAVIPIVSETTAHRRVSPNRIRSRGLLGMRILHGNLGYQDRVDCALDTYSRTRVEDLGWLIQVQDGLLSPFSSHTIKSLIEFTNFLKDIQVDRHRVMHDVCIVLSSEDETCTTHISSKLIDLIKRFEHTAGTVRNSRSYLVHLLYWITLATNESYITQISLNEFVSPRSEEYSGYV